jgi:hypothetical protein
VKSCLKRISQLNNGLDFLKKFKVSRARLFYEHVQQLSKILIR